MEKRIIITKRFRKNTFSIYQYLIQNFSRKTALLFLDRIEDRLSLIAKYPTIGKASAQRKHVRSIILSPHNLLFYRYQNNTMKFYVYLT